MITQLFLHKTPYTHPSFQKKLHFPSQKLVETFTFYHIFSIFTVDQVCNIPNKYRSPRNLTKYQYFFNRDIISLLHFEKNLALAIPNIFWNIHFLLHFRYLYQCVVFAIFQVTSDFLINQQKKCFYTRRLTPLAY